MEGLEGRIGSMYVTGKAGRQLDSGKASNEDHFKVTEWFLIDEFLWDAHQYSPVAIIDRHDVNMLKPYNVELNAPNETIDSTDKNNAWINAE